MEANTAAIGVFYVDGHVRAYHGGADVPKAHLARMRLSMPAEADTWVCDSRGDGVLVWQAPPGASLVGELRLVAAQVRSLVGADARPTIAFDRGGWSPASSAKVETRRSCGRRHFGGRSSTHHVNRGRTQPGGT